jgi:protocatechuate 3,4-dioxygenase beta subunit
MLQPHINVTIFSRGLLKHVFTRLYFPDEPPNAPVLNAVPCDRRSTLIARAEDTAQKRVFGSTRATSTVGLRAPSCVGCGTWQKRTGG